MLTQTWQRVRRDDAGSSFSSDATVNRLSKLLEDGCKGSCRDFIEPWWADVMLFESAIVLLARYYGGFLRGH